jgi:hypothetical protein
MTIVVLSDVAKRSRTHFALKTDCIRVFVENRRELSNQAIEGRSDAEPNTAPRYTASDSP